MTKKDYELIADAILKTKEHYHKNRKEISIEVMNDILFQLELILGDYLYLDNPNFNSKKFIEACTYDK